LQSKVMGSIPIDSRICSIKVMYSPAERWKLVQFQSYPAFVVYWLISQVYTLKKMVQFHPKAHSCNIMVYNYPSRKRQFFNPIQEHPL
jgi:hypothetical protein